MTMTVVAAREVFSAPIWVYISIPIFAALVGWATKHVAIKMMFEPVEFRGIPPFLGWQGQIPKRAPKMAAIAVDSLMTTVLKPAEIFDRIDPEEMAEELSTPLHAAAADLVETIMTEFQPRIWALMPDPVRKLAIANVQRRVPKAARNMFDEIRDNLDQVFDLKHVVVSNLVRDKALLNQMFRELGADAFKFMIKSGLYFGFLIGLVQMLVFGLTGWHWSLPVFGLLTGGLTDYIALQMIFRPKQRRTIVPGVQWQGLFHAQRDKVTRDYAALLTKDILTPHVIMESLLSGPMSDKFFDMISQEIQRTVDDEMGIAARVITVIGGRQYQDMKKRIADQVINAMPEHSAHVEEYAAERLDMENTIVESISAMDNDEYEALLRPAIKDDEWVVVAVGAALGFLFGELQVQVILALV
jgi:uncharacterized membrane protein YheB (UPF0754 family)